MKRVTAARRVLRAAAWASPIPSRLRTGRASAACSTRCSPTSHFDERDDEAADDAEDKPIRLAVAGRPNVGKSTLINTWLGEERLVRSTCLRHHARRHHGAVRAPWPKFQLIDTAGLRRKGEVFEAIRSSRWSRRCRPSPTPTSCCCCSTPPRARVRAGRPHRGLRAGKRPRRGAGREQVGRHRRLPAGNAGRSIAQRLGVPEVRPGAAHLGHPPPGPGPVWQSIADARASAFRKMSHAGADPPAARGGRSAGAQAGGAWSRSCATRTRAA